MTDRASESDNPPTALILVDVINSFFLEGMPNHYPEAADVLPALRQLLAQARNAGRLVVHAVERHRPGFDDYEWRKLPRHHFADDPDAAFVAGFAPSGRARDRLSQAALQRLFRDRPLPSFSESRKSSASSSPASRPTFAFARLCRTRSPTASPSSCRERRRTPIVLTSPRLRSRTSTAISARSCRSNARSRCSHEHRRHWIREPRLCDAARTRRRSRTGPRPFCPAPRSGPVSAAPRPMSQPRSSPPERGTPRRSAGSATTPKARLYRNGLRGARRPYGRDLRSARPNADMHSRLSAGWAVLLSLRSRTDGVGRVSNESQRVLLGEAEAICVTVGPTKATWETLRLARPDAALVWAVKADPRAVPPDLAAALAARADVVIFSRGEAEFAAEAFAAADAPARIRCALRRAGAKAWPTCRTA